MAAKPKPRNGPRLKDYTFREKLGEGAYATVYKAERKVNPQDIVAIKCIEIHSLSPKSKENLLTEIQLMKQLDHKHIVKLKDFNWDKTYIYIIMEYCSGGDLLHLIHTREKLEERVARRFLRQLALALKYLHERGIAHMDLKPQNLLLSSLSSPILKVADFGVAQHLNSGERGHSQRGSPLYMAPEIFLAKTYDSKVDLWSVGVILYEAVYGRAPLASNTLDRLMEKVMDPRPIQLPDDSSLSEECRDLLSKLLQRNPEDRMSFEEFFAHPFVDLDQKCANEYFHKGQSLIKEAVAFDSKGHLTEAMSHYRRGLDLLLRSMEYQEDPVIRQHIARDAEKHIKRAEELKEELKARKHSIKGTDSNEKLLNKAMQKNPDLKTAMDLSTEAEEMEAKQDFEAALNLYMKSIELLLPVAECEKSSMTKKLLKSQVTLLIMRAEELKVLNKGTIPRLKQKSPTHKEGEKSRCPIQ
jgi:serine/threonine-protein kinase ULK/ATG1